MAKYILKTREKDDFWLEYRDENSCSVIAEINPDDDLTGKLSLKNCQAIANGYDFDELAEKEFPLLDESCCKTGAVHEENLQLLGHRNSYIKGLKKALELMNDKKFSEADIKEAYLSGVDDAMDIKYDPNATIDDEKYLKSLQQKEWEVEIIRTEGIDVFDNAELTWYNPKHDADGCLILKRIV